MSTQSDIFLSYSRDDQVTARLFAEGFERAGFSVWWDVALKSGVDYDKATEHALRSAKAVVVLWSKKSVESRWVRTEATIALQNQTLVPAMIEICQRPIMFELSQSADLTQWKGDDNDKLWLAFVNDVRQFVHKGEGALASATLTPGTVATASVTRKPALLLPFAAAALLVVGVTAWSLLRTANTESTTQVAVDNAMPPATTPTNASPASTTPTSTALPANLTTIANSIAVLPFANISPNADDAYFATGLHEEILNQLAKVSQLKVISRQSVLRYAESQLSIPEIAKELRVTTVMEGSVRYAGNRIRITAQLIDAATDAQLWSETFDEDFTDVFAIESQVAMQVANAMKVSFSQGEAARISKIPTTSPEAYALYLNARSKITGGQFGFTARPVLDAMLGLLDQAIALDPQFALAYVAKGNIYSAISAPDLSEAARLKAVELDPDLANVDTITIFRLLAERREAAAEPLVLGLLERSPNDIESLNAARELRMQQGRNSEALTYGLRVQDLFPGNEGNNQNRLGIIYSRLGQYENALQAFERDIQRDPDGNNTSNLIEKANILAVLHRPQEALGWLKSAELMGLGANGELGNPNVYSALINSYALAGATADVQRLFQRFLPMEADADLPTRARVYVSVGDYPKALELLQQMATDKSMKNTVSVLASDMLRDNPYRIEALNRPEFVEARGRL